MEGMHRILDIGVCEQDVLATVIHVDGSAYRREGACMLFREDGTQIGLLSAGCLEADVAARVQDLRRKGVSETIVFDMQAEDDLSWGQGAGCNGAVHVLLEPVDERLQQHLKTLKLYLDQGIEVTILKKLNDIGAVSDYLFLAGRHTFGEWSGHVPEEVEHYMNERTKKSGMFFVSGLSAYIYVHTIWPKSRVIVFGAGMDAIPLVKLAAQSGFSTVVSDWRPALCSRANFPEADELIVAFPEEAFQRIRFTPRDFILILTHQFQRDQQVLRYLLTKAVRYIGVLGSNLRTQRLLGGSAIPPIVKSPVGLSIGADGPEEIAVSIVAELISLQRSDCQKRMVLS
jgi:xanthine/CO dehydrogenase XdhC/CoxF family maturation factor